MSCNSDSEDLRWTDSDSDNDNEKEEGPGVPAELSRAFQEASSFAPQCNIDLGAHYEREYGRRHYSIAPLLAPKFNFNALSDEEIEALMMPEVRKLLDDVRRDANKSIAKASRGRLPLALARRFAWLQKRERLIENKSISPDVYDELLNTIIAGLNDRDHETLTALKRYNCSKDVKKWKMFCDANGSAWPIEVDWTSGGENIINEETFDALGRLKCLRCVCLVRAAASKGVKLRESQAIYINSEFDNQCNLDLRSLPICVDCARGIVVTEYLRDPVVAINSKHCYIPITSGDDRQVETLIICTNNVLNLAWYFQVTCVAASLANLATIDTEQNLAYEYYRSLVARLVIKCEPCDKSMVTTGIDFVSNHPDAYSSRYTYEQIAVDVYTEISILSVMSNDPALWALGSVLYVLTLVHKWNRLKTSNTLGGVEKSYTTHRLRTKSFQAIVRQAIEDSRCDLADAVDSIAGPCGVLGSVVTEALSKVVVARYLSAETVRRVVFMEAVRTAMLPGHKYGRCVGYNRNYPAAYSRLFGDTILVYLGDNNKAALTDEYAGLRKRIRYFADQECYSKDPVSRAMEKIVDSRFVRALISEVDAISSSTGRR